MLWCAQYPWGVKKAPDEKVGGRGEKLKKVFSLETGEILNTSGDRLIVWWNYVMKTNKQREYIADQFTVGERNHDWFLCSERETKIYSFVAENPEEKKKQKNVMTERKYFKLLWNSLKGRWWTADLQM